MADIQIFPREVLLFKNKKLFALSLLGSENKIYSSSGELKFSFNIEIIKSLQIISDNIIFEEDFSNRDVEIKIKEDNLPVLGIFLFKEDESQTNEKIFSDNLYFSSFGENFGKDYEIVFDDFLVIGESPKNKTKNNVDYISSFSFFEETNISKNNIDDYLFSFEDFNNYIKTESNYEFKLMVDDSLINDVEEYLYDGQILKDALIDNIKKEKIKLLVYKNNNLAKTYLLRNSDNLLLEITNFSNPESTFDVSFDANYKALDLNVICHNNNVFEKGYINFCNVNYFNFKKLNYKIVFNNNCKTENSIRPIDKNSSCIVRIYFGKTINIKNVIPILRNKNSAEEVNMKFRNNLSEILLEKMKFSDSFYGYCKILDILLEFSDNYSNTEILEIDFEFMDKNKNKKYESGYNQINDSNILIIDSLNLLHKTNGQRDIISQYGNYIGYKDGETDIVLNNIYDDYKGNIYTNSDNATIEFKLKRDTITYKKIYCDYYYETYKDNSIINLENFLFLGKGNGFPKYLLYSLNEKVYSYYQSSYTTDINGQISNYFERWKFDNNNYFSLVYNLENQTCYLEIVENGFVKKIDESNVYSIDNDNKKGFYYYYLGDRFYFTRKEPDTESVEVYYKSISSSEYIKYNSNSVISGDYDVDIKVVIKNGKNKKYILRSIIFKDEQALNDKINLNLNNYFDTNGFTLGGENSSDIDDCFYNVSCEFKSKYSSNGKSLIENLNTSFFNKTSGQFSNYYNSNFSCSWNRFSNLQYIVLFDEFVESNYNKYFLPFNDINQTIEDSVVLAGDNMFDYFDFINDKTSIKINKFSFTKPEIITNIIFSNIPTNNLNKIDCFYSYSIDGDNWSEYIHNNYFKCFYARFVKVVTIFKNVSDFYSDCSLTYLDTEKYILLSENSFDSIMHRKILSGKKYIFRLIKYYNKKFSYGKTKLINSLQSDMLPKIESLYVDDILYSNNPIRVSSSDNIVKLSWVNPTTTNKYNIKIYIDGNLYENIITNIVGINNLYEYFLIFDTNFKSKVISYTVSYLLDNNSSYESNNAYFYINNKPTVPQKLGIL